MGDNIKILAFEYLLTQLIEWGAEKKPAVPKSSFTKDARGQAVASA